MASNFLILKKFDYKLCTSQVTVPQHSESLVNDKTNDKFICIVPGRIHKTTITGVIEV